MIARVWRCVAAKENVARYVEHFEKSVYPDLMKLAGFRHAYILRYDAGDVVEITVQTFWDSMDAIRTFAGDDVNVAVVEPAAKALLRSVDVKVTHYEVVLDTSQQL